MIRKNNVIVTGSDHYNTLWLVRSLGMGGFDVISIIIKSDSTKIFCSKSRYCKQTYIVADLNELLHQLCKLSFDYKVPVFTNSDAVAIALEKSYDFLEKKYILHHCNHCEGGIKYWMNKSNMFALAKKVGIYIPASQSVDLIKDTINFKNIPYPCIVKPEVSADASKKSFRVCHNEEDLKIAVQEIRFQCSNVLIQEFVQSDYEYLVYGVSTENEVILPGGLRKVHTCLDVENLGMASYAYLSDEIPEQLGSFERIKHFVREMGYLGVFSVEFMITKDKACFLEINLRNDGTCYFTTQAGVNIPSLWAANVLGLDTSDLRKTLIRPRTYGMNEVNYVKYTLKSQSIITSFKELLRVKAFSLCKWDDMQPVIAKILFGIQKLYKKCW